MKNKKSNQMSYEKLLINEEPTHDVDVNIHKIQKDPKQKSNQTKP